MKKTTSIRLIMQAAVLALLALAIPLVCKSQNLNGTPAAATAPSQLANDLIGTWVEIGTPGHVGEAPAAGGRFKFRTGNHWILTRADPTIGLVVETFGGTYSLNGDEYVETQGYGDATWRKDNGKSFKFTVKVEGDIMTQTGVGNPYTEVWKRVQ